jgi:hypothetical protein
MSLTRLGRGRGISIKCDHGEIAIDSRRVTNPKGEVVTEYVYGETCETRSITGNLRASVNREFAAKNGWLRESLPVGGKRRKLDICPGHAVKAREILDALAAKRAERVKKRAGKAKL